jgi:hypothetical protein
MTVLEIAQQKLDVSRERRRQAGRDHDYDLEQKLAAESYRCWIEVIQLQSSKD